MASIDPFIASGDIPFIICRLCKCVVFPLEVYTHLQRQHKVSPKSRRDIEARVKQLPNIIQNRQELGDWVPPAPGNNAIAELKPPINDGFACDSCGYVVSTINAIQVHFRVHHDWVSSWKKGGDVVRRSRQSREVPWRIGVQCQHLGQSRSGNRWFEVERGREPEPVDRMSAQAEADKRIKVYSKVEAEMSFTQQKNHSIMPPDGKSDVSPWLDRVGWPEHLAGQPFHHWVPFIREPGEDEPVLQRIDESLERIMDKARSVTSRAKIGHNAMCELRRKNWSEPVKDKPFDERIEPDTWVRYKREWRRVIWVIDRTRHEEDKKRRPPHRLTPQQGSAWDEWTASAQRVSNSGREPSKAEAEEMDAAGLRMVMSIMEHPCRHREYQSALLSALAIRGIDESGTSWLLPLNYTTVYAAIIKVARFIVALDAYTQWTAEVEAIREARGDDSDGSDSDETEMAQEKATPLRRLVRRRVDRCIAHHDTQQAKYEPGPVHWIWAAMVYGKKIRFDTPGVGMVQWRGETLTFGSVQTTKNSIADMCRILVGEAEEILHELTLTSPAGAGSNAELPRIPWSEIVDDQSNTKVGESFLTEERNKAWVKIGDAWIARRIEGSRQQRKAWYGRADPGDPGTNPFRTARVKQFATQANRFRQILWVVMHILSGGPARAPEILGIRMANTAAGGLRNIYIDEGMLMFVTLYHKGSRHEGNVKIIYRYPPREVGSLLVWYIWLVLPFWQTITKVCFGGDVSSPWVWARAIVSAENTQEPGASDSDDEEVGHHGRASGQRPGKADADRIAWNEVRQVWTSDKARRAFQQHSGRLIDATIHISAWRHIAIAISNRYLKGKSPFDHTMERHGDEADSDDEFQSEAMAGVGRLDEIRANSAGHGMAMEEMIYAREVDQGQFGSLSKKQLYRLASRQWHHLFGFAGPVQGEADVGSKRGRLVDPSDDIDTAAFERRLRQVRRRDLQDAMREMVGSRDAKFREEQEQALQLIKQGWRSILVIMGTGRGKTMLFQLPAYCAPGGTTIVIVPLSALREDIVERCVKVGIDARKWNGNSTSASIVFAIPEQVKGPTFQRFIRQLHHAQKLDRVVVDECHYISETSMSFRHDVERTMQMIASWDTQVVYLTASLGRGDEDEFFRRMHLSRQTTKISRHNTSRPNIRYRVVTTSGPVDEGGVKRRRHVPRARRDTEPAPTDPAEDAAVGVVQEWIAANPSGKVIIYVPSRAGVDRVAARLGCQAYHADSGDEAEKNSRRTRWSNAQSGMERVMAATNAFGLGIDVPDVRLVVHVQMPRSMAQFVQESGRAGRDGHPSESVIIYVPGSMTPQPQREGRRRMQPWHPDTVTFIQEPICRRFILDISMDSGKRTTPCRDDEEPCGHCEAHVPPVWDGQGPKEPAPSNNNKSGSSRESEPAMSRVSNEESESIRQNHIAIRGDRFVYKRQKIQEGQDAWDFEAMISHWDDFCFTCCETGHTQPRCEYRGLYHDSDTIDKMGREVYTEMYTKKRFAAYTCCFHCGLPQSLCRAWEAIEGDEGSFQRSGFPCNRPGILAGAWATIWNRHEALIRDAIKGCPKPTSSQDDALWQWLGDSVNIGPLQTNNMCKALFRVWQHTRPGSKVPLATGLASFTGSGLPAGTASRAGSRSPAGTASPTGLGFPAESAPSSEPHSQESQVGIQDIIQISTPSNDPYSSEGDQGFRTYSPIGSLGPDIDRADSVDIENADRDSAPSAEAEEVQRSKKRRWIQGLTLLDEFCPWCWSSSHSREKCPKQDFHQDEERLLIESDAAHIRTHFQSQGGPSAGCIYCGFPQEICARWVSTHGDWQETERACNRGGMVMRLWGGLCRRDPERCHLVMHKRGYQGVDIEEYWSWMRTQTSWRGLAVSQLFPVVMQTWAGMKKEIYESDSKS